MKVSDFDMNILFYTECWIEKSLPHYRAHSIFIVYNNLIKSLQNSKQNFDFRVITGDGVYYSRNLKKLDFDEGKVSVITQKELKDIFPNYKLASQALYNKSLDNSKTDQYKELISSKIGEFKPDIIFSWESTTFFLQKIYPDTLIINALNGLFSRQPFPLTYCFDFCGLYKDSFIAKFKDELNKLKLDDDKRKFIDHIRKQYFDNLLTKNNPIASLIAPSKKKFEKLVLLPLQAINYFAFEENCNSPDMFTYICDVLDEIDPRIGVIVTEKSKAEKVINDLNIKYLKNKYPNFIYYYEFNDVQSPSQFLLEHVDGCIFVSSTVGLMASLIKKPVFQIGRYESFVSSGNKVKEIYNFLKENKEVDKDAGFYHLFTHYYISHKYILDGKYLYNFFNKSLQKYRKKKEVNFSFYEMTDNPKKILEDLINKDQGYQNLINNKLNQNLLPRTENNLVHLIRTCNKNIISFDIFDTLLIRPFHAPYMLFYYMEIYVKNILKNHNYIFSKIRINSEKKLRKEKMDQYGYHREVHIDEIYNKIHDLYGIDIDLLEKIKKIECDLELQLCYKRQMVFDAYSEAVKMEKRIIIISDTYLDIKFVRKLLNKNGYKDFYKLFCSSQIKQKKSDGKIYEFLSNSGLKYNDILHIGDCPNGDIKMANKFNINTFYVKKIIEKFENNISEESKNLLQKNNVVFSIITALAANKCDNILGDNQKSLFFGKKYNLGYYGMGPLLFSFTLWLITNTNDNNSLYFVSREGEILSEIYNIIKNKIASNRKDGFYIQSSRQASQFANIKDFNDIINLLQSKGYNKSSLKDILNNKFCLDINQLEGSDLINQDDMMKSNISDIVKFLKTNQDYIINIAAEEKKAFLKYLNLIDPNFANKNTGITIIDIGYKGTIQNNTSSIINRKTDGRYMLYRKFYAGYKNLNIRSFLNVDDIDNLNANRFTKYMNFLEHIMTDNKKDSIRSFKNISTDRKKNDNQIQVGIKEFINDIFNIFDKDNINIFNINSDYIYHYLEDFFCNPSKEDAKIFEGELFENNFDIAKEKYIAIKVKNKVDLLSMMCNNKILWEEGFYSLNQINSSDISIIKKKQEKEIRKIRRLNKLANDPDLFWSDLRLRPIILLKPFLRKKNNIKKYIELVLDPRNFFSKTRIYPLRILKYLFKRTNHD